MAIPLDKLARKLAAFMTLAGFVFILVYAAKHPAPPPPPPPTLASLPRPLILRRDDPATGRTLLEILPHAACFQPDPGNSIECRLEAASGAVLWRRWFTGLTSRTPQTIGASAWAPLKEIASCPSRVSDELALSYYDGRGYSDAVRGRPSTGEVEVRPWQGSDPAIAAPSVGALFSLNYVQVWAAGAKGSALGIEFRLFQEGKLVAQGEGYSHARGACGDLASFPITTLLLEPVESSVDPAGNCVLVVVSRPDLAIQDLDHDACWDGRLMLTATLFRDERTACRPASPEEIARHMPKSGGPDR